MAFRKIKAGLVNGDPAQFIGEPGNLFFDIDDGALRLSDGVTPGGNLVSSGGGGYTLPTATTTTKGGVKVDGTTISIANQIISVGTVPYSSLSGTPTIPTAVSQLTNDSGYITSVGTISYNSLSDKPTLFSGSYTDLTNKPTIPTNTNQLTNGAGFISSYTETDPVFAAHAAYNVTNTKISNWDTAYGWGNHASAGYLTSVGTISYNDLSNKPTIPTTVSQLTNDSGYITDSVTTLSSLISVGTLDGLTIDSSGETPLSITATGRPGSEYNTWSFFSNQGIGGPSSWIQFPDSTLQTTAWTGNADTVTNGVYTTDTGTVTNTMLAGSIANNKLANSSITIGNTAIALGSSSSTLSGVAWITFAGSTSGTTQLRPSAIAGTTTVTMPGTTGTLITTGDTGTVTNAMLAGSIANSKLANSSVTVNGTSISLGSSATITVNSISASGFTGVLGFDAGGSLILSNTNKFRSPSGLIIETGTSPLKDWTFGTDGTLTFPDTTVQSTAYTGNAATVTDGVYTTGSYSNPSWITSLAGSKVTNAVLTTDTGTVTNTMLAGSIANSKLANSSITINGSATALGGSVTITTITGNAGTATKLATARAINGTNFDGSADITITAAAGTLTGSTLASGVTASSLTSLGTLTSLTSTGSITANASTAFIAGDNAISNVALQMPSESALRNLTNGSTNMYFDVSIGGSTQGQFQFRSSSSYTNVLTMSSTGVSFNTDATFTSRTPSVSRTAFNSAIDTEITLDNMRFRISNQGGIFPQVIGNGSSRNLAWTGVGAISGSAVAQVGSVGTIVADNAWTTLYNLHGMDNAGDTVTVTLQDKAAGRIYRITFMRSDNGSTTGYNIIGERIL